ncbi:MAG: T9SS type A sorting domain-containing protein [Candidatus Stahlbacteria bacterium]|nr:T9SS type A sorting domain-containing protein [Candidatus Stahlbacteria bacterium]
MIAEIIAIVGVFSQIDTLKYDDGKAEGFYVVGEYRNDKIAVKFIPPYTPYTVQGILVFTDGNEGFKKGQICVGNGLPDTINTIYELDTVYSAHCDWQFTPIRVECYDSIPVWIILDVDVSPAIGGDTNTISGNSFYYSDDFGWRQAQYNWLIQLIIQNEPKYFEPFATSNGGYTGDWEYGVPTLIQPYKDNCFGTRVNNFYPNHTYLHLESPWLHIKEYGISLPVMSFLHFYDTEYEYDGGNVKITNDGVNWRLIAPVKGYNIILSGATGLDGEPGFSGTSYEWKKEYFLLPAWDSMKIAWCFGSDTVNNDYGWFIDEVKIGTKAMHDVATVITNCRAFMPPQTQLLPSAEIKNLGLYGEGIFTVKCTIESCGVNIYCDTCYIFSLDADSSISVNFRQWQLGEPGTSYRMKIYTSLPEDEDRGNDTIKTEALAFSIIDSITVAETQTIPKIDGIIDSIEWQDAIIVDGSDILGVDAANPYGSCKLYFMTVPGYLCIACKVENPVGNPAAGGEASRADALIQCKLYIDESGDGKWNTNGSEGFYSITTNEYKFQDMYYHIVYSLPDSLKAISNQEIEIIVPISNNEPYEIMNSESLKCFVQISNVDEYCGWWPQDIGIANYNNPLNYAKMKIIGAGIEEFQPLTPNPQPLTLEVYPNPFCTKTNIKLLTLNSQLSTLKIYDLAGRVVKSFPIPNPQSPTTVVEWDASHLANGTYFLICKDNHTKIVKKLTLIH